MTVDERKTRLKKHNPFVSSSVGDPWHNLSPDVTSIYQDEFDQICSLLNQKKENPAETFSCLVTGEAGSGKTHLIGRLLGYCRHDPSYSFAYIQPLENYQAPYNYLLKEIVTNLCKDALAENRYNQLDRQIGVMFKRILIRYSSRKDPARKLIALLDENPLEVFGSRIYKHLAKDSTLKAGIKALEEFDNQFDDEFLQVLFSYRLTEQKRSAIKWLKTSFLESEESKQLRVRSAGNLSIEELEAKSRQILRSLGLLFSFTGHTMILCFDRLENLGLPEQTRALGRALEFFIDVTQSYFPLVFYRGETWERSVKDLLNQQITTRLETNKIDLQGCDADQSMQIIHSRLKSVISDLADGDVSPLEEKTLRETFSNQRTLPREVIIEANRNLQGLIYDSKPLNIRPLNEILTEKYNQALVSTSQELDDINPDGSKLFRALNLYLSHFPGEGEIDFTLLELSRENLGSLKKSKRDHTEILGLVTRKTGEMCKVFFLVDDSEHPRTIQASLKRGVQFLQDHPDGKAFYIRDERSSFQQPPKWKATHECLDDFRQRGGTVITLDKSAAVGWYTLTELDYRLGDRDLTYTAADGTLKEVDSDAFFEFVQTRLHSDEFPWFHQLDDILSQTSQNDLLSSGAFSEQEDPLSRDAERSKSPELKGRVNHNDPLSQKIVSALATQNLTVEVLEVVDGFRFKRFKLKPVLSQGTTVRKLKNQAENLQVELGIETTPYIQAQAGYVSVDIPKKTSRPLYLKDIIKTRKTIADDPALSFPLGATIDNQPVWADFSDPNMSSILVGGSSGSGKSIFLKSIALGLAQRYCPSSLKIVLIDPKRVTFSDLAKMPHLLSPIIMDNQEALKTLLQLVDAMEDRYQMFEQAGVMDIIEYNRQKSRMPRFVILIDEYADLMMDKKSNEKLVQAIQRIGQKGRAAGIHLVLSTQRPDSRVITPLIKANLQLKVALKVTSVVNRIILVDQGGAECLMGKGDMLVGGSVTVQRLQGPMVKKVAFKDASQS